MTIVYLDSFLLINFVLNYLLLLSSGKLAGERLSRWRFALASGVGAVYAACSFFPGLQFSLHPIYKLTVALVMLLISFGQSPRLLRISAIFLAIACAFCGGIYAIEFLKGSSYMKDGIVYSSLDAKGLLMSAAFCYGLLALFFRRSAIHSLASGDLLPVSFFLGENSVDLTALQDSGNTLQDPLSGQQIPVVEGARLGNFFPADLKLDHAAMASPIETMARMSDSPYAIKFRLLPYRAVGVECGVLLAVRMDRILLKGEYLQNQLVALSPTPVSDGGAYSVLIGCRQPIERMGA